MTMLEPGLPRFMYPSGAGGHWFMNTLHRLAFRNNAPLLPPEKHYHSVNIWPIHYDDHWIIRNIPNQLYFGDWCIFNFYVNYVEKLNLLKKFSDNNENVLFGLTRIIESIFSWYEKYHVIKDLTGFYSYTELWKDPQNFINNFDYAWHNAFGEYAQEKTYSKDILQHAIVEYTTTVIDPAKYYNQLDDPIWLAWCWYLLTHYELIDVREALSVNQIKHNPELLYNLGYWSTNLDLFSAQIKRSHETCLELTDKMTYTYPKS